MVLLLIVVGAIVAGGGAFLLWVIRQPATDPEPTATWDLLMGRPGDLLGTDRELRRATGDTHAPDDDDKIVV